MKLTPRKAGYATVSGPQGTIEYDTITCGHCQTVVFVRTNDPDNTGVLGYGHCTDCAHDICEPCLDKSATRGCEPWMKRLERSMERCRFLNNLK